MASPKSSSSSPLRDDAVLRSRWCSADTRSRYSAARQTVVEARQFPERIQSASGFERLLDDIEARRRKRGRLVGRIIPVRILTVVDFPAPFGPRNRENLAGIHTQVQIAESDFRTVSRDRCSVRITG